MVMVEFMDVGLTTISKAAMSRGMNHFVFVVYSNALATLILLPSSFIFHRSTNRPSLTISLLCRFFILGLFGTVYSLVNYSSPTLGSALSNLIPAFTFILAIIFRMEKLDLRSSNSQVKIMGTLVTITGALAATIKIYPAEMTVVSFYCFFGTIQCVLVSMVAVADPQAWVLSPGIELTAVVYSAVFGSVVTPAVQTWCIHKKGPVFISIFKPLGIAIAAIMGVIFLDDSLYLGSVFGAIVIVLGFYGVVWAQSKEERKEDAFGTFRPDQPFLQSHQDEQEREQEPT
ncbi:hypothetical protein AQUCO_00500553v1 [Aquilegia coerulea]|uniref:WAT1-related protein n=1 Tax=Aquilegia coerulea TaxID=218851 RepID=A0A2G5ESF6_AQUCA|nr:hypothetical protein AQUCO_00500553v1 [Aquilegia coerulea]